MKLVSVCKDGHEWSTATGGDFYRSKVSCAGILKKYLVLKAPVTKRLLFCIYLSWMFPCCVVYAAVHRRVLESEMTPMSFWSLILNILTSYSAIITLIHTSSQEVLLLIDRVHQNRCEYKDLSSIAPECNPTYHQLIGFVRTVHIAYSACAKCPRPPSNSSKRFLSFSLCKI
jgi:hypothetical protein